VKKIEINRVYEFRGIVLFTGINEAGCKYICIARGLKGTISGKKMFLSWLDRNNYYFDRKGFILGKLCCEITL
jgi:hypothetical protein